MLTKVLWSISLPELLLPRAKKTPFSESVKHDVVEVVAAAAGRVNAVGVEAVAAGAALFVDRADGAVANFDVAVGLAEAVGDSGGGGLAAESAAVVGASDGGAIAAEIEYEPLAAGELNAAVLAAGAEAGAGLPLNRDGVAAGATASRVQSRGDGAAEVHGRAGADGAAPVASAIEEARGLGVGAARAIAGTAARLGDVNVGTRRLAVPQNTTARSAKAHTRAVKWKPRLITWVESKVIFLACTTVVLDSSKFRSEQRESLLSFGQS